MAIVGMTTSGGGKAAGAARPAGGRGGTRAPAGQQRAAVAVAPSAVAPSTPGLPLVLAGGMLAAGSVLVEVLQLPLTGLFALSGLGIAAFGALLRRQPVATVRGVDGAAARFDELAAKLDEGIERLRDVQWEMRDSDVRYRDLLDNQVDVIMRRDRRGRISFVNDAFCKTFGVDQNAIVGTPFELKVVAGDPTPAIDDTGDGQRRHYEQEIATLKGRRWFLFEQLVIRDETGEPREAHTVGRDVTEEKKAAQELQEARDLSEQANRAKTRFLATISHEIRTPMNGIMGMTDLLADSELTAEQRTYCRAIGKSATTLLSLIDEILDYAKIEAGKFEATHAPYDLTELAEGVIELLAPRAFEKGLSIGCFVSPDLPQQVVGDEPRMRQILLNLVGNAVKFTERGGIALEIAAAGERLRFAVADTGIGLSKEDMDRIFIEFEQVDDSMTRRNGGTGLGLAISRRLVGKLGGEIGVTSQRQKGSTFTVEMPLVRAGDAAPLRERLARPQGVASVLVACDHEVEGRLIGKMLKSIGLDVAVKDRRLALELLQNDGGHGFDAVITDAIEAPLYAADLLRAAQTRLGRPVKGLMLIESTDRRDYEAMRGRGYNAYVTRPVRHDSLLKQLETVAARSVLIEPETAQGAFSPQPLARVPAAGAGRATLRKGAAATAPAATPPAVATVPAATPAKGRKARILLAEDNDINALLGIRLLEHLGHEVTHVTDGQLALQAIRKAVGGVPFDLVLMDIHMPHMDGFTATQEIRAFEAGLGAGHRPVPIVALTANAFNEVRSECREAGMNAYLAKPFAREELQETIDSCLAADAAQWV